MAYPKIVYQRAWTALQQRRQEAREGNLARREEAYRKIPRIREIEREMAATAAGISKAVLGAPHRAGKLIGELGEKSLALQQEREGLLLEGGFPASYLEERFACDKCRDSGSVRGDLCDCFVRLLRREAYRELSAACALENSSFDTFDLLYYAQEPVEEAGIRVVPRQWMEKLLTECRRYAESFGPGSESLLMQGQTGLGKTHLSLAIAQVVIERGYGVVYTPVQKLMDRLEAEKFSKDYAAKEQYQDTTRFVLECDLLVLDDLGTEFSTPFTTSALYNIINTRLVENRPTIINTNLKPAEIEERYSQRMASRLVCSYNVFRFYGRDVRYLQKMGR